MKNILITLFTVLLFQLWAMAQYTGGVGRGDFKLRYPACNNPTNAGTISASQNGCAPLDPSLISVSDPTGYVGTLEYKWQSSTDGSTYTDLSTGTYTATTYDPEPISVSTWYKRLVKVTCEGAWVESYAVKMIVLPNLAGTGTATDPYLVATAEDLNRVRCFIGPAYAGLYFKMTADIDLAPYLATGGDGYIMWGSSGWDPIGTDNPDYKFYGQFDGDNFNVTGLKIDRGSTSGIGLFGSIASGALLQNMDVVIDPSWFLKGQSHVGGLVGVNAGLMINCNASGEVIATNGLSGGLVGHNSCTILKCYAAGNVTGTWSVGGLVGYNHGGTITQCYSRAEVNGDNLGGLVGQNDNSASINECYATGLVGGGSGGGGLVGNNSGSVNNSYWDKETTGRLSSAGSDISFGKTTAEMTTLSTFVDWDFTSPVWAISSGTNDGYPSLSPPVQASAIVFSTIQDHQMTIGWTNGNETKRVVFVKKAIIGTALPINNVAYTANTTFGDGTQIGITGWYCVYNGTGANVTVSGLTENSNYIFQVFEYNDACGANYARYNTITGTDNPKSQNTTGPASVEVTATDGTLGPTLYVNLTAAFDAINAGTHKGDITIKIIGNTTETATAVLNASAAPSDYDHVKIYPTLTGLYISGTLAAPLIDLNGASNVTINGSLNESNAGKDLTIINASTSAASGTSTIRFINDASGNLVANCKIMGSSTDALAGIVFFSTGTATGNNGNTVNNNDITNATDADRPLNAVYSSSNSGGDNSGNTISNNNIFDFFNPDFSSDGVLLGPGSTDWAITGNSFYETTNFEPTSNNGIYYSSIEIYNTSGNNFTISGNFIGGSNYGCNGMMTVNGAVSYTFVGIYIDAGASVASSVQNNTIRNIDCTVMSESNYNWSGIYITNGAVNVGTQTGNTIGSATGNGSITVTNSSTNWRAGTSGIENWSGDIVSIQNNTIGSITTTTAAGSEGMSSDFYGIANFGPFASITNNIIGSTTTANSINAASPATSWSQKVFGIYSESDCIISENTIANLTNATTNTDVDGGGSIFGIYTRSGSNTITNNTIHDLTIASANALISIEEGMPAIIGILQGSKGDSQIVTGNTIYNLSDSYPDYDGSVIGLYYSGGTSGYNSVSNNFIHSLSVTGASSTAASLYGILIEQGNAIFYNNVISLGGNSTTDIYGIQEYADASQYLYIIYNTVYIGGSLAAGATNSSYALYSAGILNYAEFVNNIFHNARSTEGGSELHFAAYFVSDGRASLTCNYNDYFAPGTGGVLGSYTTNVNSLPIVTGQDTHSLNTDPNFSNAGGTVATNYMPHATLNGTVSEGYPGTDYAGTDRADIPTMGAFEKLLCANPINGGEIEAAQAICLGSPAETLTNKTTPSNQTGTLQYQWQSSVGGAAFTNLTTGTYTLTTYEPGSPTVTTKYKRLVKVTCESTWLSSNEVEITVNPLPTATAGIVSNVNCFGDNTGSVIVSVLGGTTAYSYLWSTSPVQSASTATGLASGTYSVTVTDANGCKATASTAITQPVAALVVNAGVVSNVSCFGGNNGSVNVSVSGGTTNYSYAWSTSPAQTAATASGLGTGTYYVTVTDGNSCTATASATLTSPPAAIAGAVTGGSTICSGFPSATLTLGTHTGTIVKWQYSVSPFETWLDILNTSSTFVSDPLTETTQFKAVVQSGGTCDLAYSDPTTVTVIATVAGTVTGTSPVCTGSSSGLLTLSGQTGSVLRWQYSDVAPYNSYTNIASTVGITTYTSGPLAQTTKFRAVVKNGSCSTLFSTGKLITVSPASVGGSIASEQEICSGTKPANLVLSGHTGSVVKWEKSDDAAFTAPDAIPITSTTLTGATIGSLTESTYFRAVVKSGACAETNSDYVLVTVNPPTVAGSVSGPSPWVCEGSSSGELTLSGQTGDVVKWQSAVQIATVWTWTDIAHTDITYTSGALNENTRFRAVVQSGACAAVSSGFKLITVRLNPTFTDGSVSTPNCYGADVEFTGNGLLPNINNTFNYTVTINGNKVDGSKNSVSDALGVATYSETGLGAGSYSFELNSIVVAGCTTTIIGSPATFVVSPQLLAGVDGAVTNVSCHGGENGSIAISVSGGTPSYTYSWSTVPEQTSSTATSLTTGTYTVTVTDNNGCSTTASASVTEPAASLSANAAVITEVNCAGGNTGSIEVSVSGGTTNYSYAWSTDPVQTTSLASGLTTGTYTVTVTDGNSCTATASATVVQAFNTLTADAGVLSNVGCFGGNSGSIEVSVSGGKPDYTYLWSTNPAQTSATATALTTGTYTVTVTDKNGCTATSTAEITQSTVLTAQAGVLAHVSCIGGNNGSANVSVSGGTTAYSYAWSTNPVQTAASATALISGTYTVTVTDGNGCTATSTAEITQPTALTANAGVLAHVSCFGGNNGSANVSVSGGTTAYSYAWSTNPVQTAASATALIVGTYTVTVTDKNGCEATSTAEITQPTALTANAGVLAHVSCFGGNGGSADVSVSGGTTAYSYAWSTDPVQTAASATALIAGTYTVTVTDKNGCEATSTAEITQPAALTANAGVLAHVSCFGGNNGSANVSVSGGTTAYSYAWSTDPVQTAESAIALIAGTYAVTVTDGNGCTATASTTVNQPVAALTPTAMVVSNVSIYQGSDGSVTVSTSGGTSAYSYQWSTNPVQTSQSVSGLSAGVYSVTVTDLQSCSAISSITVTQPTPPTVQAKDIVFTKVGSSQFKLNWTRGDGNGCAVFVIKGTTGLAPPVNNRIYTPSAAFGSPASQVGTTDWYCVYDDIGTTVTVTGLDASSAYRVHVCEYNLGSKTYNTESADNNPANQNTYAQLLATASVVENVSCNGLTDGSVVVTVSGGNPSYSYSWSTVPEQTASSATGLSAGIYTVTVTDGVSATITSSVEITQPDVLEATATVTKAITCHQGSDGEITVSVSGGTTTYSYAWSTTPVQTAATATGLSVGSYSVTVTDANGCTATSSTSITQPIQWWPELTGSTPVCQNSTGNVYTTDLGMTNYTWLVSAGGTITSGGTGTDNTVTITWTGFGPQTVSVNYTSPAGCVAVAPKVKNVMVNIAPTPAITGEANVTQSQVVTYSTPYNPVNTYSWNASHGNPELCFPYRNCLTLAWDFPCGIVNPGYVRVTETNTSTGCSTTVTMWITIAP